MFKKIITTNRKTFFLHFLLLFSFPAITILATTMCIYNIEQENIFLEVSIHKTTYILSVSFGLLLAALGSFILVYLYHKQKETLKNLGEIQQKTENILRSTAEQETVLQLQSHILDAVQDSIFVHDNQGKFIYINENAWKTRGYTKEELMQMSVRELDAPEYNNENPEEMKRFMTQIHDQGWLRFEVEHVCKDGKYLPVEIHAREVVLNHETYILSTVRDISDRKKTQQILEESEKKYKNLVEHSMVGVYRTDMKGNILYVNKALAQILGFESPNELIGQKSLMRYQNPKDRELFIRKLEKEQYVSNYELNILDKNLNPVLVMVSATLENGILSGMVFDMREIQESRTLVEKLSKAVEQIDDILYITDKFGNISYVNGAYCRHTGYTRDEVLGQNARIAKSGMHDTAFYKNLWTTILRGDVYRKTLINKKKNGDFYYEKKTITPLLDDNDKIIGFISSGKDVTEETMLHQEVERIATTDQLTGLYNRHKFEEVYRLESERSRRFTSPLSLILIDIDHFKAVNDRFGHDIGDLVLQRLAAIIKDNIRKFDVFARWGGEEFLILSPGTDLQDAEVLAEKLRSAVEFSEFPVVKNVTISLGISVLNDRDTFSDLFKRADEGLYRAKESGRNKVGEVILSD